MQLILELRSRVFVYEGRFPSSHCYLWQGKGGDAALEWASSGRLFTVLLMHWLISPGNKL